MILVEFMWSYPIRQEQALFIDSLKEEMEALKNDIGRMGYKNSNENNDDGEGVDQEEEATEIDDASKKHMNMPIIGTDENDASSKSSWLGSTSEFASTSLSSIENAAHAILQMSREEEEAIFNIVHGQERPEEFQLTCPKFKYKSSTRNYNAIIGYHVGMIHNWKHIARDQLHTLDRCGLGDILTDMYVTYSNNATEGDIEELQDMFARYSNTFGKKIHLAYSPGQPCEGVAINALHSHCARISAHHDEDTEAETGTEIETVVFYFHTKGNTKWKTNWKRTPSKKGSYTIVHAWRKYLEYFTIERPELCIRSLLSDGDGNTSANACGVFWNPKDYFYRGNFWASKCSHLKTLTPLEIHSVFYAKKNHTIRWLAEYWITLDHKEQMSNDPDFRKKFVSLHEPSTPSRPALAVRPYIDYLAPSFYSDFTHRWGEDDAENW